MLTKSYIYDMESEGVKLYKASQTDKLVLHFFQVYSRSILKLESFCKDKETKQIKHVITGIANKTSISDEQYKEYLLLVLSQMGYHLSQIQEVISEDGELYYQVNRVPIIKRSTCEPKGFNIKPSKGTK